LYYIFYKWFLLGGHKKVEELKEDLNKFLINYKTSSDFGRLKKEFTVRTPWRSA